MCTDLQTLKDPKTGAVIEVPCRKCRRCINNRVTAMAGRAFAEMLTATKVAALTLTYGDGANLAGRF